MKLLIGTWNKGKAKEISTVLGDLNLTFLTLNDFAGVIEVEESGNTYRENAILKAEGYARQCGVLTLADDSGLEVNALNGAPGVRSARYAGDGKTDQDRVNYLLDQLTAIPNADRGARFVSVVVLADHENGFLRSHTGTCEGAIIDSPRGTNGFGYDPIFAPTGFDKTFGELPSSTKDQISHRGKALAAMRSFLKILIKTRPDTSD
ncbi:MAG TPA: RdgB/HAM1 family non-canonical purine NTP pyrophosphatase [Pyrinomonadaceae bacterium]|nr:RdgB/HAM1 family non-canonical purine NTP pyrophosphatase [Pyrinomonadaceae bacterium]